jgi:hypothetical protein
VELAKYAQLIKIKLTGNVYMAAGGLFAPDAGPEAHAREMIQFSLEALEIIDSEPRLNSFAFIEWPAPNETTLHDPLRHDRDLNSDRNGMMHPLCISSTPALPILQPRRPSQVRHSPWLLSCVQPLRPSGASGKPTVDERSLDTDESTDRCPRAHRRRPSLETRAG